MAMLGKMADGPYSPDEVEMLDNLRLEGSKIRFQSKDRKGEDTIKGLIQLRLLKPAHTNLPRDFFGYEEFKVSEDTHANSRQLLVKIVPVNGHFSKLTFVPDKRGKCTAMCPDTRWNRLKLADAFFQRWFEIEGRITADGEEGPAQIRKEIEELAVKRRAELTKSRNEKNPEVVDRLIGGLTAEQKAKLLDALVAEENKKREPIRIAKAPIVEEHIEQEVEDGVQEKTEKVTEPKREFIPYLKRKKMLKDKIVETEHDYCKMMHEKYGEKWYNSKEFQERLHAELK